MGRFILDHIGFLVKFIRGCSTFPTAFVFQVLAGFLARLGSNNYGFVLLST